jgi:PAS domain-containing protein
LISDDDRWLDINCVAVCLSENGLSNRSSSDMIATDGTIVQFNDAAERVLGYRRAEVVSRQADQICCDIGERDRLYATVYAGQPL